MTGGEHNATPTSVKELFAFYMETVKPLYAVVQVDNAMPQEMLFELSAAFDHLSRHWVGAESEAVAVGKAYAHLKRSCLDAYKIKAREARIQYERLRQIDISVINNGQFERDLHSLFHRIRIGSEAARRAEGTSYNPVAEEHDHDVPAFPLWAGVLVDCVSLEMDFHANEHVEWARSLQTWRTATEKAMDVVVGLVTSVIVWSLTADDMAWRLRVGGAMASGIAAWLLWRCGPWLVGRFRRRSHG